MALIEGLTDPTCGLIMGRTAELLAREFGITREEADRFALESHQRAQRARDAGPLRARDRAPSCPEGAASAALHDDGIRDGQTLAGLAKLKPYFETPDGIVTVGNSCGITDGATALLVDDRGARALTRDPTAGAHQELGLRRPRSRAHGPRAGVRERQGAGRRPAAGWPTMGVVELNEAFAAQVLACTKAFASEAFAREQLGRSQALGAIDPARSTRTAARSRWGIRSAPPARASCSRRPTS